MKTVKYVNEKVAMMSCKYCNKIFQITYDGKKFPCNINKFNWGAFFLYPLWGLWNGMPILFLVGICFGIMSNIFFSYSILLLIIELVLRVYLGICGNKLSWKRKAWSSPANFEMYQNRWKGAGIAGFCTLCFMLYLFSR